MWVESEFAQLPPGDPGDGSSDQRFAFWSWSAPPGAVCPDVLPVDAGFGGHLGVAESLNGGDDDGVPRVWSGGVVIGDGFVGVVEELGVGGFEPVGFFAQVGDADRVDGLSVEESPGGAGVRVAPVGLPGVEAGRALRLVRALEEDGAVTFGNDADVQAEDVVRELPADGVGVVEQAAPSGEDQHLHHRHVILD